MRHCVCVRLYSVFLLTCFPCYLLLHSLFLSSLGCVCLRRIAYFLQPFVFSMLACFPTILHLPSAWLFCVCRSLYSSFLYLFSVCLYVSLSLDVCPPLSVSVWASVISMLPKIRTVEIFCNYFVEITSYFLFRSIFRWEQGIYRYAVTKCKLEVDEPSQCKIKNKEMHWGDSHTTNKII